MQPPSSPPGLRLAGRQFVRLLRLIRPYWSPLLQILALGLVLTAVGMVAPYLSKLLIDEVYPTGNLSLMHLLVGGILALGLAGVVLGTIQGYFSLSVHTRLHNATALLFFNHLQHLEARFFDHHQVGEIMSRFQDVRQSLDAISRVFQTLFVNSLYLLLVPPLLFFLEWRLALVALVTLPLTFVLTAISGRVLRPYWQRTSEAYADLNAFQVETLSHIRTWKALGLEHRVFRRAHDQLATAMEQQFKAGGLGQLFGAANGFLRVLNTALFTWFGWHLILAQDMTLGDYIAFTAYIGYLYNPIAQFLQLLPTFQQSAVHLGRMFEYLDAPVEQDPALALRPPAPPARRLDGPLRLEGITFGYDRERPVLHQLDLEIPRHRVTAIVGPSGSGKTSLLKLLTRLEQPDTGRIWAGDILLHDLPLNELRQQIAVVWQEVSLIKGTLWENLTLGADEVEPAEIDRLIELCGLAEVVAALPDGLATAIGEWGASLSAGQRQRVAIARALARKPPLLLLDEATANVDVTTELRILRAIFREYRETTVVFVTHRLASAALADRVAVLADGRLVGCGSTDELLRTCEVYRQLHAESTPHEPAASGER